MAGVNECNGILAEHLYDFKFKDKQYDVVLSILNGRDTIGLLPTGYGKSLCYFVPPLLLDKDRVSLENSLRAAGEEGETIIKQQKLLQLRATRKSNLPNEPAHGISLKFRTSNGRIVMRRFLPESKLEMMTNFVGSLDEASEHFDILPPDGPPLNLSATGTISDLGVPNRTLLVVKWLPENPNIPKFQDSNKSPDEVLYQELDTPTITFRRRPHRDAAELARVRMHEWVHTLSGTTTAVSRASATPARPESPELPELDSDRVRIQEKVQTLSSTTAVSSVSASPARPESPKVPELSPPEIHVTDEAFESEIELNHEKDYTNFEPQSTSVSLSMDLASLARTVIGDIVDGCLKIIIRRRSALQDALQNISRAQTRLLQPLAVRFIAEPAIDDGGPSRELSSEVVNQLINSPFVEGTETDKVFRNDFKLYSTNKYLHLGQLTALLLLQGGQGLPVFCQSVTEYILSGTISSHINDLPESIRKAFRELKEMSDADVSKSIDDLLPCRFEQGYPVSSNQITRDQLPELIQAMVAYHVIQPQKMALDQFVQGLQIGGVLDTLQHHKEESLKLFKGAMTPLTMDAVESLLKFNYDSITPGSNRMVIAQALEQGLILLLQAAESGGDQSRFCESDISINLCDILKWLTGGSRLPAIGLTKSIDIFFDKDSVLPRVNTCSLETFFPLLPRLQEPESVMQQLVEWIVDSHGFGLV